MQNYLSEIDKIIKNSLEEDVKNGDITTEATVSPNTRGKAVLLAKDAGVLAGVDIMKRVFEIIDNTLEIKVYVKDGELLNKKDIIATVEGKAAGILIGERTALNFMQRMSGIATSARIYQEKVQHTKAKVIDTRKTVPGLRVIDKLAVKIAGCENHRIGLYDMFLIKDNHIVAAGSITEAVKRAKEYKKIKNADYKIEVETKNIDEVKEALASEVDVIMLDNFNTELMKEAVALIDGKCKVEASGGININTIVETAETGVDYISVGAITHSVKALDISLNLELE